MTSDRSRARRSSEDACVELVAGAGTQFDPEIAQVFVEQIRRGPTEIDEDVGDTVAAALPLDVQAEEGGGGPLTAASTDGLTLLGNHRALAQDLQEKAATAEKPFALLLVQLEDLPRINEDAGYAAGDRTLRVAARNAQLPLGRADVRALSRWSGQASGHRSESAEWTPDGLLLGWRRARIASRDASRSAHAGELGQVVRTGAT